MRYVCYLVYCVYMFMFSFCDTMGRGFRQRLAAELVVWQSARVQTLWASCSLSSLLRYCMGQTTKLAFSRVH